MCNSFNHKFLEEAAENMQKENFNDKKNHSLYMQKAVDYAIEGMKKNDGGPFGCIIVKDGKIIGRGNNRVTSNNDPTAHAEIIAIREACENLNSFQLDGCIIYTSCEPCPMCLGAIYWARPKKVFFGSNKTDAADVGFDDDFIYKELPLPMDKRSIPFEQMDRNYALKPFKLWEEKENKTEY